MSTMVQPRHVQYCGDIIAGVSLLSPAVMRFRHEDLPDCIVDVLLSRRSLYVIRCVSNVPPLAVHTRATSHLATHTLQRRHALRVRARGAARDGERVRRREGREGETRVDRVPRCAQGAQAILITVPVGLARSKEIDQPLDPRRSTLSGKFPRPMGNIKIVREMDSVTISSTDTTTETALQHVRCGARSTR